MIVELYGLLVYVAPAVLLVLAWVTWPRQGPGPRLWGALPVMGCYLGAALLLFGSQFHNVALVRLHGMELDLERRVASDRWAQVEVTIGGKETVDFSGNRRERADDIVVPGYPARALVLKGDGARAWIEPGPGFTADILVLAGDEVLPVAGNAPRLVALESGDQIVIRSPKGTVDPLDGTVAFSEDGLFRRRAVLEWSGSGAGVSRAFDLAGGDSADGGGALTFGGGAGDSIRLPGLPPEAVTVGIVGQVLEVLGEKAVGDPPVRVQPIAVPLTPGSRLRVDCADGGGGGVLAVQSVMPADGSGRSRARLVWTPDRRARWELPNREVEIPLAGWRVNLLTRLGWRGRVYSLRNLVAGDSKIGSCVIYGPSSRHDNRGKLLLLEPGVTVARGGKVLQPREGRAYLPPRGALSFFQLVPGDGGERRIQVRRAFDIARVVGRSEEAPCHLVLRRTHPEAVGIDIDNVWRLTAEAVGRRSPEASFSLNDTTDFSDPVYKVRFAGVSPEFAAATGEVVLRKGFLGLGEGEGFVIKDDGGARPVRSGQRFVLGWDKRLDVSVTRNAVPLGLIGMVLLGGLFALAVGWGYFDRFGVVLLFFGAAFLTCSRVLFCQAVALNYPFEGEPILVAARVLLVVPLVLGLALPVLGAGRQGWLGRLDARMTAGVRYRWLMAAAAWLLLLRVILVLLGFKERITVGTSIALSVVFVPAFLILFGAGCSRALADWRAGHGFGAGAATRFAVFGFVVLGCQSIMAALVSDLGTYLFLIPQALILAGFGVAFLVDRMSAWRAGRARGTREVGMSVMAGLLLWLPLAGAILPAAQPRSITMLVSLLYPQDWRQIESGEVLLGDSNLLRLLQFMNWDAVANMGTDVADRVTEDHALTVNYAHREFFGQGYLNVEVVPAKRATALNDNVFAVFVLAQFGVVGGIAVVLAYVAVAAGGATGAMRMGRGATFAAVTGMVGGLVFASASLYMMGANFGLLPFTGRNMYLLGLNSMSDPVEGSILLLMAAWGAVAVARPCEKGPAPEATT